MGASGTTTRGRYPGDAGDKRGLPGPPSAPSWPGRLAQPSNGGVVVSTGGVVATGTSALVGSPVLRIEDRPLLTGQSSYVADVRLPAAVHVAFVRSPVAHAVLHGIDVSAARSSPGVIDVVIASDLELAPLASPPTMHPDMWRPLLPGDRLRYVGEPVVAVVAESAALAADAVELVELDYEVIDAVVDPEVALRDEQLVLERAGTNLSFDSRRPVPEDFFDGCEVVVSARLVNNRMAPLPLEPRVGAAAWDGDELTVWASCQRAHPTRELICRVHGLDPDRVRVVVPDVGGAFGAKHAGTPEELLLPLLARRAGRPVVFVESRTENLVNLNHGRGQIQYCRLGGSADGRLLAYEMFVIRDAGAFPAIGSTTRMTKVVAPGCYDIERVWYTSVAPLTNTAPTGSFRGAGRPEAATAIERMVDLFARLAGLPADEVRRRNFVDHSAFPHDNRVGALYDTGRYHDALDAVLAAAGFDELSAEQARRRSGDDEWLVGIGVSSYVEIANPLGSGEYAGIEVDSDGEVLVRTGSSPHGQGLHTALAALASDTLGVGLERISVVHGDTDLVPRGNGTGGSRSLQTGGAAVAAAARELVDRARPLAAELLEASRDDIVLDTAGRFHVAGTPAVSCGWAEIAAAAGGLLRAEHDFTPGGPTFPFGAHLAVVEVDRDTGAVRLVRFVAVDDCGTVVNPLLVAGQVHGGVAAGVAQALYEEVRYDANGTPLTATLADHGCIGAAELPMFELVAMATPTPHNPLGAKGIGESGTTGAVAAVQNAVVDALAHLGVDHLDLPITPERVWRALQPTRHAGAQAGSGAQTSPET